jgi:hypothetical protein
MSGYEDTEHFSTDRSGLNAWGVGVCSQAPFGAAEPYLTCYAINPAELEGRCMGMPGG